MPKLSSKPRADMHVVHTDQSEDRALKDLEKKIKRVLQAMIVLKQDRDSLKDELEQARRRLGKQEDKRSQTPSRDATLKALARERDALLRDRQNTARRVETMLERLKALELR